MFTPPVAHSVYSLLCRFSQDEGLCFLRYYFPGPRGYGLCQRRSREDNVKGLHGHYHWRYAMSKNSRQVGSSLASRSSRHAYTTPNVLRTYTLTRTSLTCCMRYLKQTIRALTVNLLPSLRRRTGGPDCDRAVRRYCPQDGRKLPRALHRREGVRLQGLQIPSRHQAVHDPGVLPCQSSLGVSIFPF